jgi:hypothetical protein
MRDAEPDSAGPDLGSPDPAGPDLRLLKHGAAVSGMLLLAFAVRAAIDPHISFSLSATILETLRELPLAVCSVVISAASFGTYAMSRSLTLREAIAIAALAVALQQPFASVLSEGTAFPVIMIPLQISLVAAGLLLAEHTTSIREWIAARSGTPKTRRLPGGG